MFEKFATRSRKLERLDTGDYTPDEYARWQREMPFIHAVTGDARALRLALSEMTLQTSGTISVLDVGAGSGELLARARGFLNGRAGTMAGAEINETALQSIASKPGLLAVRCDALRLPFADNSFDVVICSLFFHHLEENEVVALIREMSRVAAKGIVAIDLERQPLPYYVYKAIGRLFLQRLTLEDGSLSILRSFTKPELEHLLREAGCGQFRVSRQWANRLVVTGPHQANL